MQPHLPEGVLLLCTRAAGLRGILWSWPTEDDPEDAGIPPREGEGRGADGKGYPPPPVNSISSCFENKNKNIWHLETQ